MAEHRSGAAEVIVVGTACLDVKGRPDGAIVAGTSNPGTVRVSVGGCARNVAENLARLGLRTTLLTAVRRDGFGEAIVRQTGRAGVDTGHVLMVQDQRSSTYVALLGPDGQLLVGVDDTAISAALTPEFIQRHADLLASARMVVIDASLPTGTCAALLAVCAAAQVPVVLEPVAYVPALRYRDLVGSFYMVTPNVIEAQALTGLPIGDTEQCTRAAKHLIAAGVEVAIITMGSSGLVFATSDLSGYMPAIQAEVVDQTGAGDALTAAVIYALLNDIPVDEAVRLGVSAATLTLRSPETVCQELSLESLYAQMIT